MRHILLLLIIPTFFATKTNAQNPNFEWVFGMGGQVCNNTLNRGYFVECAVDGSVYIIGNFCDTIDFDPGIGVYELSAPNAECNYVAKYSPSGNFIWAKKISGAAIFFKTRLDSLGNLYLAGSYSNYLTFDSTLTNTPHTIYSNGLEDCIVLKLSSQGDLIFEKTFGAGNYEFINSLEVDQNLNIYLFGIFANTIDFDPGPNVFNITAGPKADFFMSKLDQSGNFLWAKSFGGDGVDVITYSTKDADNNFYLSGYFTDSVDFDLSNNNYYAYAHTEDTNTLAVDYFILKIDTSCNFKWIRQGSYSTPTVTYDRNGYIYAADRFHDSIIFGIGPNQIKLFALNGFDGYVIKYDTAGNVIWVKQIAGDGDCAINSFIADYSGNLLFTGYFTDTMLYDPNNIGNYHISTLHSKDIFFTKWDSNGGLLWSKQISQKGLQEVKTLTMDINNHIYLTGLFQDTVDFDPDNNFTNLYCAKNKFSIFLEKFNQYPLDVKGVVEGNLPKVFPNPNKGQFMIEIDTDAKASIFNIYGQIIYSMQIEKGITNINISDKACGIYFIQLESQLGNYALKVFKE